MGATDLLVFPTIAGLSHKQGFRLCGGDKGGNENRRSLRSPPDTPSQRTTMQLEFDCGL